VQLCVVPRAWLAAINQGHPCFFQWFRGREGSKEPAELIQGAVSAKLISSPDDEDKQLQVGLSPCVQPRLTLPPFEAAWCVCGRASSAWICNCRIL
jgi:hypothetical protein